MVKPSATATDHALIHCGHDFTGLGCVVGESAESADQERNGHGCGKAFSTDVADDDECSAGGDAEVSGKNRPPTSPNGR